MTVIILAGCHTANSPAAVEKPPKSLSDSLYEMVIHYHNEAMPKMGKLIGYQKALQGRIDSLNQLASKGKTAANQELKERYAQMIASLKAAETGMNNWMDSFEPDPKIPSKTELEAYWKDQQVKTKKMRDAVLQSADSARALLGI
jgi:hypothetical protein